MDADSPPSSLDPIRGRLLARAARAVEHGAARLDAMLDEHLAAHPDPRRAYVHLDRLLETAFSPAALLDDLLRRPAVAALFFRMVGVSDFAADTFVRDPHVFRWLTDSGALDVERGREEYGELAQQAWARFPAQERAMASLKRMHRREMLRVIARDLDGRATLEQTTAELSGLADSVVDTVLAAAMAVVSARMHVPMPRIGVLALGKLGGNELNYSSDIDLMAVYQRDAAADAAATHQCVSRVIELLIRWLSEPSADGFLYRTDFRLRPDGGAGAPALSFEATLAYYESRGAAWERQMLLKARPAAGDRTLAAELLTQLSPFVYPRSRLRPPSAVLRDVAAILEPRLNRTDDVKHGRGGIRCIEFAVQALQLLHAPEDPSLRHAGTVPAIDALERAGRLALTEAEVLRDSYRTLRRVEHLLQLEAFEQTHALPRDAGGWTRLAWALGHPSADACQRALSRVRSEVAAIFESIVLPGTEDVPHADVPSAAQLGMQGFRRPDESSVLCAALVFGRSRAPRSGTHRLRAAALLPALLEDASSSPLPDEALEEIERLLDRTPVPGQVLELLGDPRARRFLLSLAAWAPVMLRTAASSPIVLDAVFGGWDQDAHAALGLETLRLIRETGAVGRYVTGDIDMARLGEWCSAAADAAVRAAWLRSASGAPVCVIALGKYGSRELGPGGDLDLVFVAEPSPGFTLDSAERAVARFVAAFQAHGHPAPAYSVDARLRPEGRSSPLVATLDAWHRYLDTRAEPWERQALLRARVVAGDAAIGERALNLFAEAVERLCALPGMAEGIREMRLAMEPRNRFNDPAFFDVKLSDGGLVDAEFGAQALAIAGGAVPPTPLANTFSALEAASRHPLSDVAHAASEAAGHYAALRRMHLLLRLLIDTPSNLLPRDEAQRTRLARACGHERVHDFDMSLTERRMALRRAFTTMLSACAVLALCLWAGCSGSTPPPAQTPNELSDPVSLLRSIPVRGERPYPVGGRHKPALTGTTPLHVLVVWVRFRDDTLGTASWPDPGRLPRWAETMLDPSPASIGKHMGNLSAYFRETSRGYLTLTGDVELVTTRHDESWYHTAIPGDDVAIRGVLAREVLETLTDPEGPHRLDLTRYDRWSSAQDFTHQPGSDGHIDMLWLLTRSYRSDGAPAGGAGVASPRWRQFSRTAADLSVADPPFLSGGVAVNSTSGSVHVQASGLTIIADNARKPITLHDERPGRDGVPSLWGELIHEFSHHLFGAGHFGDGGMSLGARRYTSYFTGYSANSGNCFGHHLSYEKLRLGWIDEGDGLRTIGVGERDVTVTLRDAAVEDSGDVIAVRINLPNTSQHYLLEWRGWKGAFETRVAPYNTAQARWREGLLVTHIIDEPRLLPQTRARIMCADGRYRWVAERVDPGSWTYNNRDRITRGTPDPLGGYDERERIFIEGHGRWWIAGAWPNGSGSGPLPDCSNCLGGVTPANDNVGDAWDVFEEGDVITPVSNPTFTVWNGRQFVHPEGEPLGMHVVSVDTASGRCTVRIVRGALDRFPPPKPAVPRIERLPDGRTRLSCARVDTSDARTLWHVLRSDDGLRYERVIERTSAVLDVDLPATPALRSWYRVTVTDIQGRTSAPSEAVVMESRPGS